ncbi:MAG: hypothetical protein AAGA84_08110 [Pseudomonadota bacterium]
MYQQNEQKNFMRVPANARLQITASSTDGNAIGVNARIDRGDTMLKRWSSGSLMNRTVNYTFDQTGVHYCRVIATFTSQATTTVNLEFKIFNQGSTDTRRVWSVALRGKNEDVCSAEVRAGVR